MVSWPKIYATFKKYGIYAFEAFLYPLSDPQAGKRVSLSGSNFLAPRSCENMQFILLSLEKSKLNYQRAIQACKMNFSKFWWFLC